MSPVACAKNDHTVFFVLIVVTEAKSMSISLPVRRKGQHSSCTGDVCNPSPAFDGI